MADARKLDETAFQTAGPYVHIGCLPDRAGLAGIYAELPGASPVAEGARGQMVTITGRVLDGEGAPLCDAMIESWQADAGGLMPGAPGADPAVSGFARRGTDGETGEFRLRTVKPGRIAMGDGRTQAPHISLVIAARGLNCALHTRLYFEDEDNTADPVLAQVPEERRQTLVARANGEGCYHFEIRLQGAGETVFLSL